MTKKSILLKHGFINGMSVFSNLKTIESKLEQAMEDYLEEQLKLLRLGDVSNRRELLIAYEKKGHGKQWQHFEEQIIYNIDDYLSNL